MKAGEIRIGYAHETTGPTSAPDVYAATLAAYEFRWVAIEGLTGAALGALARTVGPDALMETLMRRHLTGARGEATAR